MRNQYILNQYREIYPKLYPLKDQVNINKTSF